MKLVAFLVSLTLTGFQLSAQNETVKRDSVRSVNQNDTLSIPPLTRVIIGVDSIPKTSQTTNGAQIDAMVKYAKSFLGTPYHYSGTTPSGFDCSGFINYVMGDFGFELTRTSYGLAELGKTVKLSEVRPGDLLFFKGRNINSTTVGHVAMVVEVSETEIKMIHASTSRGVVIDNFKESSYYIPRFIKAKRLDYGEK